jgi:hypothetical protein
LRLRRDNGVQPSHLPLGKKSATRILHREASPTSDGRWFWDAEAIALAALAITTDSVRIPRSKYASVAYRLIC